MGFSLLKNLRLTQFMLAAAARGEFKLTQSILATALFVSLLIALTVSSQAYLSQLPILEEIAIKPALIVSKEPLKGIAIKISYIKLNSNFILILASSNLTAFLKLNQANIDGKLPSFGEALLGVKLKPLIENSTFMLKGLNLKVSGFINSPEHLSSAVILADSTFEKLNFSYECFYLKEENDFQAFAQAPSLLSLIKAVASEVLKMSSSIAWVLRSALTLICLVQAYSIAKESRKTLKMLLALNASKTNLTLSLTILALLISGIAVALGYAIGLTGLALSSSALSIFYGLPYIKPLASYALIKELIFALTASFLALTILFANEVLKL